MEAQIETGRVSAQYDVKIAKLDKEIMLLEKEIRDLSVFDMPFSLFFQDIYERSKPLGFDFELKRYAKEVLCQGFKASQ